MYIYANNVHENLHNVMIKYGELGEQLHLSEENWEGRYTFPSDDLLLNTLVECRELIVDTLTLFSILYNSDNEELKFEHTRDLYKHSNIRVTYAIIYHDLKNVFEIIDIAVSDRSSTITRDGITRDDLENIYVAMVSFIVQTIKVYESKFREGCVAKRGRPRKIAVASETV